MKPIFDFAGRILHKAGVPLPLFGLNPSISVRTTNVSVAVSQWLQGNPLPPGSAVYLVQGNTDLQYYVSNGRAAFDTIWETLQKSWIDIYPLKRVLDFGCGCGRVLRHWKPYRWFEVHGTDYNEKLAYWAKRLCSHATVKHNGITPPSITQTITLVLSMRCRSSRTLPSTCSTRG